MPIMTELLKDEASEVRLNSLSNLNKIAGVLKQDIGSQVLLT
jgi:hypothetical protein